MSFSDLMQLARMGKKEAASSILKEEFGRLQAPEQRASMCKWIASCFEALEDYANAAEWYEMTGFFALSETSSDAANAVRALPEYEKARRLYARCGDEEKVEFCSAVIAQLSKCFVAS